MITLAKAAQPGWQALSLEDRCAFLKRACAALGNDKATLVKLISEEMGKIESEAVSNSFELSSLFLTAILIPAVIHFGLITTLGPRTYYHGRWRK